MRVAVATASRSLPISGVDVKHMTATVRDGKITEYRVDLKVAFVFEPDEEDG